MSRRDRPRPGVSRSERLSDEGLARLEKHMAAGVRVSRPVRAQWVRRYGEPARAILQRYGQYSPELEEE